LDTRVINIGYGNYVSAQRIIAIVSTDSAPVKRLIQEARDGGRLIDGTCGHRMRAAIACDNSSIVLCAILPETLMGRLNGDKK
jgi:regulator of extracellular matrix RemA (YlzA/DUF370 family)